MAIWEAFLTPRILAHRLRPTKIHHAFLSYQPNLLSIQFGIIQLKPKSLYKKKCHTCLHNMLSTKEGFEKKTDKYIGVTSLTHISYRPSLYCTQEFSDWWTNYYSNEIFDVPDFTKHLTHAFTSTQE